MFLCIHVVTSYKIILVLLYTGTFNLGRFYIFMKFTPFIQEYGVPLHLFKSAFISFRINLKSFFHIDLECFGNLCQYSCLENSMGRGAWWATVHGVAELDATAHTGTFLRFILSYSKYQKKLKYKKVFSWVTSSNKLFKCMKAFENCILIFY